MPQLPYMRDQRRAARPVSPIGQLAPGRHIGITAGVPMGKKSKIANIGISSARHYADGGEVDYSGLPVVPNALGDANVNDQYMPIDTVSASIPGMDQLSQPDASSGSHPYVQPVSTPTGGGGLSGILQALSPQSAGSDDGPLLGSKDTDQQMGTGFGGWLNNKHAGIQGSDWLKAGLTALTGILSGVANKKASKQVPHIGFNGFYQGGEVNMTSPREPAVYMASGGEVNMRSPMEPAVYMASGGQPPPVAQQQQQMLVANAIKAVLGQSQNPQADQQAFIQAFGPQAWQQLVQQVKAHGQQQGGIAAPQQGMSSGGALTGPGDGMSDSISANGGQVALSNNEHVLDAATVSDIGNGSSDAGHAKIDAAIRHLRMRKHGRSSQPPMVQDSANPVLRSLQG